ncbi:hypothetical protein L1049_018294 [Liquidambar formosana]|uniref:PGG domain-containing protein n=1 Tax=Liquidambar formosana TaxID=63359 RepID=A0AAP0R9V3_LIQFO
MAYNHPDKYPRFLAYNTTGFIASLSIILLLITGLPFKNRFFMWILTLIMWVAITSMALTYGISVNILKPSEGIDGKGIVTPVCGSTLTLWCGVMALLLLGQSIRLLIIKFLLTSTAIEINAQNAHGYTALDVLSQSPRDLRDMEIKENLRNAGASRIEDTIAYSRDIVDVYPMTQPQAADSSSKQEVAKHKHTDWLGRKRSALMIVASLIATVAFQSSLSPPGGVWQDDYLVDSNGNPVKDPHNAGKSVMAYGSPTEYGQVLDFQHNRIPFIVEHNSVTRQRITPETTWMDVESNGDHMDRNHSADCNVHFSIDTHDPE